MREVLRRAVSIAATAAALAAGAAWSQPGQAVELITGAPPRAEALAEKLYPEAFRPKTRAIVIGGEPAVPQAVGFLIQFDLDSSEIRPESQPYLDQVGKMMSLTEVQNRRLRIEGHADASGATEYNQKLSERRALAVANYLVRNHTLSPERLEAVGLGEVAPLAGRNPYDATNRRVQFQAAE